MKKSSKKLNLSRVTTTQLARTSGGEVTQIGCTSNYGPSCNEGSCLPSCYCPPDGGSVDYSFTNCYTCFI